MEEKEVCIEDFLTTKKQKAFEYDFFKKAEHYEKWEDVDFDGVYESESTFTVEAEDIKNYSKGILEQEIPQIKKLKPKPSLETIVST